MVSRRRRATVSSPTGESLRLGVPPRDDETPVGGRVAEEGVLGGDTSLIGDREFESALPLFAVSDSPPSAERLPLGFSRFGMSAA